MNKDMKPEEKKKYSDAVKEAEKLYKTANPDQRYVLESLFPELRESDDDRIKRWLIAQLKIKLGDNATLNNMIFKAIAWIEKQGEQTSLQTNERAWLYLVSDVLTWKDGIGQYLDDPRVQELAKQLCSEYKQKLYNSVQDDPFEQNPKFKVGDLA